MREEARGVGVGRSPVGPWVRPRVVPFVLRRRRLIDTQLTLCYTSQRHQVPWKRTGMDEETLLKSVARKGREFDSRRFRQ